MTVSGHHVTLEDVQVAQGMAAQHADNGIKGLLGSGISLWLFSGDSRTRTLSEPDTELTALTTSSRWTGRWCLQT